MHPDETHVPHSIELHDSVVASAVIVESALVVTFSPAYVHRDGKGWEQDARLVLTAAVVEPVEIEFPAVISAGTLETHTRPYRNLLMLPLRAEGQVSLHLEFCSGAILQATGQSVDVELLGAPTYVEDFNQR